MASVLESRAIENKEKKGNIFPRSRCTRNVRKGFGKERSGSHVLQGFRSWIPSELENKKKRRVIFRKVTVHEALKRKAFFQGYDKKK